MALNVKIFSTQRIDKECDLVENDVYVPVRCGAIFDKREAPIIGDNTGDNISHKRNTYCELTTQYWAWKNVDADYYGFCHYRRYFSFNNKQFPHTAWQVVEKEYLDDNALASIVVDPDTIREIVGNYDVIAPCTINTEDVGFASVYEQIKSAPQLHHEDLGLALEIIGENYPQYYEAAKKSIYGNELYICNMFIMRKALFQEYSEFLFGVLEKFEAINSMENYSTEGIRTPGHLGERLFGVYLTYLKMQKQFRIGYKQIVVFFKPEKERAPEKVFEGDSVNIVLSASETFAPYCAATIQSVVNHSSPERQYDIMVLEQSMTDKTKKRLQSMANHYDNISIRTINVSRFFSNYKLSVYEHFSVETYFRLLIPELLFSYEKILYLDSDLIILQDIAELFDTDLTGYAFAGVPDVVSMGTVNGWKPEMVDYYTKRVRMKNLLMQVNAGVLLFNLPEIRRQYTAKELVRYAEYANFTFADQDVINSLFEGQIKWLDFTWNVQNDEKDNLRGYVATFAPQKYYKLSQDSIKKPKIIHYIGAVKPWYEPGYQYAEEFWKVLRDTPFYEFVIHRLIVENCFAYSHMPSKQPKKESWIRRISAKILPIGTKRREYVKMFVCKLTRKPYIKPYFMQ